MTNKTTRKNLANAQRFFDREKTKFKKTLRLNIKRRNAAFTKFRKRRAALIRLKKK